MLLFQHISSHIATFLWKVLWFTRCYIIIKRKRFRPSLQGSNCFVFLQHSKQTAPRQTSLRRPLCLHYALDRYLCFKIISHYSAYSPRVINKQLPVGLHLIRLNIVSIPANFFYLFIYFFRRRVFYLTVEILFLRRNSKILLLPKYWEYSV